MSAKPVDRERFPHVYVGVTTPWGLKGSSACRIVGRRGDIREIETVDGKRWLVPVAKVKKARDVG